MKQSQAGIAIANGGVSRPERVRDFKDILKAKNEELLGHRYFRLCRSGGIGRESMLEIVKQLYCFSVFFERLLAARIAGYSSDGDARILTLARRHLHEEIGHADMFRECLAENGVDAGEIAGIAPKLFTKALFGYLEATLRHENEYVANVALIQVMESIGFHFFGETLPVMERHGLSARALEKHVEDDADHPWLGLELIGGFDEATWEDSLRIVRDLYRLMAFTLDEWLAAGTEAA